MVSLLPHSFVHQVSSEIFYTYLRVINQGYGGEKKFEGLEDHAIVKDVRTLAL